MVFTNNEIIIFILLVVVGSIITSWLYRKVVSGITTKREERSATRVGKYGKASEKIVKRE